MQNKTSENQSAILKDMYILYLSRVCCNYTGKDGFVNQVKEKNARTIPEINSVFKSCLGSDAAKAVDIDKISYVDFCYVCKYDWDFVNGLLVDEWGILDSWYNLIWLDTCKELRLKAYKLYKIQWLLHHNLDVDSIIDKVDVWDKSGSFREYFENSGFGGLIWVSYDEFLENEYQDKVYMYDLLENFCECVSMANDYDTVEYGIWLHDDIVK